MDSSKIKVFILMAVAMFAALYLGIAAATAQFEAVAWVFSGLIIATALVLGKHVWVMIPLALPLAGGLNFLPGSPSPWWGCVFMAFWIYVARFLLHKRDLQFRWTWLEFAILLQFLAITQAFLRNPTGLAVLGGDVAGGKPYIAYGFAIVGFAVISLQRADLKMLKILVIGIIIIALGNGGLMLMSQLVPFIAIATYPIYSGVSVDAFTADQTVELTQSRIVGAQEIGTEAGKAAFTLFRPISTINPMRIVRFCLMISAVIFVLLSGYRSVLVLIASYALVSSIVRRKYMDIAIAGAGALLLLAIVIISGSLQKLPYGAQRILSVLPVDVRSDTKYDASDSVEWRTEMWKDALFTNQYIKNKWLGDGFSLRADELAIIQDLLVGDTRRIQGNAHFNVMMAKGSYHGFHVETIRMTGAFGLLCALIGLVIFFRYAWRLTNYFRGRKEWGYVLYITIPFLIYPFYLMLIFGSYKSGFPAIIVGAGLLKILDNIRVRELSMARSLKTEEKQLHGSNQAPS